MCVGLPASSPTDVSVTDIVSQSIFVSWSRQTAGSQFRRADNYTLSIFTVMNEEQVAVREVRIYEG